MIPIGQVQMFLTADNITQASKKTLDIISIKVIITNVMFCTCKGKYSFLIKIK